MIPFDKSMTAIAYRVYQAFPGYNLGGSGGPTDTPFPLVYAVIYKTGKTLDCAKYDAVPPTIGHLPSDTPDVYNIYGTTPDNMSREEDLRALADGIRLLRIPEFAALQSKVGWQFAPEINRRWVTFTRPPLAPGADVSSMPPPDNCAGYLGARVDPLRIALIRLPHVASIFETESLCPHTTFPGDSQATYISLTMYGASVNTYEPEDPDSASLANAEFQRDETGGVITSAPAHIQMEKDPGGVMLLSLTCRPALRKRKAKQRCAGWWTSCLPRKFMTSFSGITHRWRSATPATSSRH